MEQNGWKLVYEEGPEGQRPAYWQHPSGAQQRYTVTEGGGVDIPSPLQNWNIPGASVTPGQMTNEGVTVPTLSSMYMGKTPEQIIQELGIQWGGVGQGSRTASGERVFTGDIGGQTYYLPESGASAVPGSVEYIAQADGKDTLGNLVLGGLMAGVGGLAFSGAGLGGISGLGSAGSGALDLAALGPVSYGSGAASGVGALSGADALTMAGDIGGNAFPVSGVTPGFEGVVGAGAAGVPSFPGGSSLADSILSETGGGGLGTGTGVSVGGAGAAGVGGSGSTAATALSRLLSGNGTSADWLSIAGQVAPGLISAYGSSQQGDALRAIAEQSRADRQPFLDKSLEWLNNPQAFYDTAGKSSLDATLRALSASYGNPIDSPTALGIASDVGAKNWMSGVTGFGNIGLSGSDTRAQLQSNAVNAGNIWPALGDATASVLTPKTNLETLLKQMKGYGAEFSLA